MKDVVLLKQILKELERIGLVMWCNNGNNSVWKVQKPMATLEWDGKTWLIFHHNGKDTCVELTNTEFPRIMPLDELIDRSSRISRWC